MKTRTVDSRHNQEPQWYTVVNRDNKPCGKLKTAKPDDNYATRMGMKLVPLLKG